MANTVLTVLVIAAGAAADLGAVKFQDRFRPIRRLAARIVWALGLLIALLAAVPYAGYYLCSLLTAPDDGYAAGWLLFLAGFVVFAGAAQWLK
jgi:hypothetical protein